MFATLLLLAAGPPADPLARLPAGYTLAACVPDPPAAVAALRTLPAVESAMTLAEVQDALTAGPAKRLFGLLDYYDAEFGPDWLAKVAGRGVAVGAMFGRDDGPAVAVAEGTDADAVGRFFDLVLKLVASEAGDSPVSLQRGAHAGAATATDGQGFHAARRGPTLYLSNRADALRAALDLTGKSLAGVPRPAAAVAWAWVDLATLKQGQAAKDFFATTRSDVLQNLVIGASVDAVRRADHVTVGLHRTAAGLKLEAVIPAPRAGQPPEFALHLPASGPGSLPLLNPPGTLYSQSFYLDLAAFWENRSKLVNAMQLPEFEKAERDISKVLPNTTLAKLLDGSGPYHRLVVADVPGDAYATKPRTPAPAAAVVLTLRDPAFGRTIAGALRAGALLATAQYKLRMSTVDVDGVKVVCYRFPEGVPLPGDADPDGQRFNAVPCFAVVDRFVVVASRPELVRAVLPELRRADGGHPAVWRGRFDPAGLATFLERHPEPVIARGLLDQGLTLADAEGRAAAGLKWLAAAGATELTLDHRPDAYVVTLDWSGR
jgi:hypothetical protein